MLMTRRENDMKNRIYKLLTSAFVIAALAVTPAMSAFAEVGEEPTYGKAATKEEAKANLDEVQAKYDEAEKNYEAAELVYELAQVNYEDALEEANQKGAVVRGALGITDDATWEEVDDLFTAAFATIEAYDNAYTEYVAAVAAAEAVGMKEAARAEILAAMTASAEASLAADQAEGTLADAQAAYDAAETDEAKADAQAALDAAKQDFDAKSAVAAEKEEAVEAKLAEYGENALALYGAVADTEDALDKAEDAMDKADDLLEEALEGYSMDNVSREMGEAYQTATLALISATEALAVAEEDYEDYLSIASALGITLLICQKDYDDFVNAENNNNSSSSDNSRSSTETAAPTATPQAADTTAVTAAASPKTADVAGAAWLVSAGCAALAAAFGRKARGTR